MKEKTRCTSCFWNYKCDEDDRKIVQTMRKCESYDSIHEKFYDYMKKKDYESDIRLRAKEFMDMKDEYS